MDQTKTMDNKTMERKSVLTEPVVKIKSSTLKIELSFVKNSECLCHAGRRLWVVEHVLRIVPQAAVIVLLSKNRLYNGINVMYDNA